MSSIQEELDFIKDSPAPEPAKNPYDFTALAAMIDKIFMTAPYSSRNIYTPFPENYTGPSIPISFLFGPANQYEFEFAKQLTRERFPDWNIEFHTDK